MPALYKELSHLFRLKGVSDRVVALVTKRDIRQISGARQAWKIATGHQSMHHTGKARQIHRVLAGKSGLTIYETCGALGKSGKPGICSMAYARYGTVISKTPKDGDWVQATLRSRLDGIKADVIDIDGYGPPIAPLYEGGALQLLGDSGYLFLTWPGISNVMRWPSNRARYLAHFGVDPDQGTINSLLGYVFKLSGFLSKMIDERRYGKTTRQVWQLQRIFTGSARLTNREYDALVRRYRKWRVG